MKKRKTMAPAVLSVFLVSLAGSARADIVTFNFNPLSNGASNASVQTYMNGVLGAGQSVVVTGSKASNSWTGDGHVVGPVSGTTVTSLYLGNSDNGVQHGSPLDTFLINDQSSSSEISMVFSGLVITSVSFDYEIFPDASCPTGNNCGSNQPDFTFNANGFQVFNTVASQPAGTYTHSPNSGSTNTELAPQFLGSTGVISTFPNSPGGVTRLDFIDWPVTVGIDNLVITTASTPEPASLILFGTLGALALLPLRRRSKRATSVQDN